MNTAVANQFFEVCSKELSFLVGEHGFKPPVLRIDQDIHFALVVFMGRRIAIECIYDERERLVEFKVAQMIDGEPAKNYEADKFDNRIRENLMLLMHWRGAKQQRFRQGVKDEMSVFDMFKRKVSLFSDLLREYGQDILEGDPLPDVFSRPVTDHF